MLVISVTPQRSFTALGLFPFVGGESVIESEDESGLDTAEDLMCPRAECGGDFDDPMGGGGVTAEQEGLSGGVEGGVDEAELVFGESDPFFGPRVCPTESTDGKCVGEFVGEVYAAEVR